MSTPEQKETNSVVPLPYANLTATTPLLKQQQDRAINVLIAENVSPDEITAVIQEMPIASQVHAFHLMPQSTAEIVYSQLNTDVRQKLIEALKQESIVGILTQLSPEERRIIFEEEGPASPEPDDYFGLSFLRRVRKRIFWLFALLVANLGTTIAIETQTDVIERLVILAAFIPLLIGSGGHVSTQSATVIIRELSQNGLSQGQAQRKILSEAMAGIWIGLILGVLMTGVAFLLEGRLDVAMVVGSSLMAIAILSTISGTIMPFIFKALGFDPALISAPLSATIVDVIGVLIYLGIARLIV